MIACTEYEAVCVEFIELGHKNNAQIERVVCRATVDYPSDEALEKLAREIESRYHLPEFSVTLNEVRR